MMLSRSITASLRADLAQYPAVALWGPRQAGKTTVVLEIATQPGSVYLDLESEQDLAKLASPELYLAERTDRLVVLDEVHRAPGEMFLVQRLNPWHANLGKRLTKSPKLYVRDSGLLHALLGLEGDESVLGHPVVGASWEGFVIKNLITAAGPHTTPYFYRSSGGAEVDLLLARPGDKLWAIAIKRSLSPKVARGFHAACDDLQPVRKIVVYPGTETYMLGDDIQAMPLASLCEALVN